MQSGDDVVIDYKEGTITLKDFQKDMLDAEDFAHSWGSWEKIWGGFSGIGNWWIRKLMIFVQTLRIGKPGCRKSTNSR